MKPNGEGWRYDPTIDALRGPGGAVVTSEQVRDRGAPLRCCPYCGNELEGMTCSRCGATTTRPTTRAADRAFFVLAGMGITVEEFGRSVFGVICEYCGKRGRSERCDNCGAPLPRADR